MGAQGHRDCGCPLGSVGRTYRAGSVASETLRCHPLSPKAEDKKENREVKKETRACQKGCLLPNWEEKDSWVDAAGLALW